MEYLCLKNFSVYCLYLCSLSEISIFSRFSSTLSLITERDLELECFLLPNKNEDLTCRHRATRGFEMSA